MSIYVTDDTRVIIQGATGRTGRVIVEQLEEFGTAIAAGVAPGHGGETLGDVPVYNTVSATTRQSPNMSLVTVPAPYAKAACFEAIEAGIDTIVVVTEQIPIHDTLEIIEYADRHDVTVIGPNTVGVISPGIGAVMLCYEEIAKWYAPGNIGIVARSGSLSTEIADQLTQRGIGQSTVLSVGGDPYLPTPPASVLEAFDADPATEAAVYVGEIGGRFETAVADVIDRLDIPVFASVVGQAAPPGKKMGHAGAVAGSSSGVEKLSKLNDSGAYVSVSPFEIPDAVEKQV